MILCRVALGRDFSRGGEYDRHGFQKMLDDYQALLGGFSLGDYFPSMEFVHSLTGMKSKLINTYRRFDQFFDGVINEHRNNSEGKLEEQKDLVDVLLDIQKNGSSDSDTPLTMDNVKAVILDMFAAGTDTTFITLDWTMTELIMNPRVMEKAQAEIRSIVGERKVVQESDLLQFHYMKAVIKEIFRLHPPVPVLVPRESLEDVVIDGYDIPPKHEFMSMSGVAIVRKHIAMKQGRKFKELFGDFVELLGFNIGVYIAWLAWVNHVNGLNAKVERVAKELDNFLDVVVDEHMRNEGWQSDDKKDFVDVLLWIQKENMAGFPIDRTSIKALILVTFFLSFLCKLST
ncbi:hypothetical protein GH714_043355 [Hevea brasiliensis]|uniref:Cytochrome P450 n=1 Tax=Hevea brasiliensis TaxID=3981 RepID=A0A6A6K211_HEVBR|nr:hypothetical protein GH714_043355 [Hevea brasiliensis]